MPRHVWKANGGGIGTATRPNVRAHPSHPPTVEGSTAHPRIVEAAVGGAITGADETAAIFVRKVRRIVPAIVGQSATVLRRRLATGVTHPAGSEEVDPLPLSVLLQGIQ